MSITCAQFVELVTDYLEDSMDAGTRTRFEEHLARCPGCQTYLDQFRVTIGQVGRLDPDDISPTTRERLLAAFDDWRPPRA